MELTAVLTPAEEGGYVALNPETGTTTQGETVEEAIANLQEATALYLRIDAYAKAHHLSRPGFLAKAAVSEMEQ